MRNTGSQVTRLKTEERIDFCELTLRVKDGDLWAMEAFYQRFVHKITGIASKLLRNSADIEDAVQDTFVQAFRDIHRLQDPNYLERWVVRIVIHRAYHHFRKRDLKRRFGLDRSIDDERLCEQIGAAAPQEARAELALLDAAFDAMKIKDRTCFVLRYLEGYGLEEVAIAADCSIATAKRRIARAKDIVDRHFAGDCHD
jgi:RNA polymerase sigma-70 factor (ECF subfamily)